MNLCTYYKTLSTTATKRHRLNFKVSITSRCFGARFPHNTRNKLSGSLLCFHPPANLKASFPSSPSLWLTLQAFALALVCIYSLYQSCDKGCISESNNEQFMIGVKDEQEVRNYITHVWRCVRFLTNDLSVPIVFYDE